MRRPLIALTIALAAFLAACTSAAPGWTYAPPTPPPASQPAASGGASAAPSGAASAAPSGAAPSGAAPSGAASAAPSDGGAGGGSTVQISALNIAFEQKEVSAPANAPFTIAFDNKDSGTPHNVAINDANNQQVFKGDIVTGVAQATYNVAALAPGSYTFVCSVHPNMSGSLKVGG